MVSKLQIQETITVDNLEVLKVLSDPTRLEIMKHIGAENRRDHLCTVKQLAKLMDVSPTKLYYHIKLLEEQGLLIVGDTRVVSGIIEKQYQVVAHSITLSQSALSTHDGPIDKALEDVFNSIEQIVGNSITNVRTSLFTIYEEERAAKEGGPPARKQVAMTISRDDLLLTSEQAIAFEKRLAELRAEFDKFSDQNIKAVNEEMLYYEATLMFVPQYQRKINKKG